MQSEVAIIVFFTFSYAPPSWVPHSHLYLYLYAGLSIGHVVFMSVLLVIGHMVGGWQPRDACVSL
jgi:hypothetical protein